MCNTLGSNWARSTYTYYVLLYVVHFRILFFSSFSLACSGGQILSKNRACKTWCYMYIPREVAPTTRLARLRKNGCTEFFLIWMIACNVDLSSMVRFWRNSDGLNFFLCGQTWRGGRRGGGGGGRGGRGPPPPAKPTVLHSVRTCNDCGTYSLIYHTLYIGTSHTRTSPHNVYTKKTPGSSRRLLLIQYSTLQGKQKKRELTHWH